MFSNDDMVSPRTISAKLFDIKTKQNDLDPLDRNLAMVQWTQFIEHDLSKAVVTSMSKCLCSF